MRRRAALGLAAAALAFPVAGAASAGAVCTPHHCINKNPTAVYTTCRHPFNVLCVYVPVTLE